MQNVLLQSSTITAKGQTTIPKAVRDALDLRSGDTIAFEVRPNGVSVHKLGRDEDTAIGAFLAFLARDIQENPAVVQPLSEALIKRATDATLGMDGDYDGDIIGEVAI